MQKRKKRLRKPQLLLKKKDSKLSLPKSKGLDLRRQQPQQRLNKNDWNLKQLPQKPRE